MARAFVLHVENADHALDLPGAAWVGRGQPPEQLSSVKILSDSQICE
jgi:hypothetical protein